MNSKGITQFLLAHAGKDPVSFHMPGHKGDRLLRKYGYGDFLDSIVGCDITEIIGADNLFQTEGIIADTMAKYRSLYDTKASYLLINGSSAGLIASILTCVPAGGKLIMARNCHKAIFNALTLGGIKPVYAYPSMVEEYGITGPVAPEEIARLLGENPDASAVILPSPNYYGICSDVRAIADIVHDAGKFLIVDQAHGAHLKFFENTDGADGEAPASGVFGVPESAETQGADFVINSTHKTLCSFTQSAVLNVPAGSTFDDLYTLEDKLQQIESTSPSYLLMASLDINADILTDHAQELIDEWRGNLNYFYEEAAAIDGLKFMRVSDGARQAMDMTKINLDMSACGLDGHQLEDALLKYEIYAELVTGNILMCMTGIGNSRRDYDRLLEALKELSDGHRCSGAADEADESAPAGAASGAALWTKHRTIHDVPIMKELIPLEEAAGRICAASLIPYPPGIPLICPGEEIGAEEIAYIQLLRGQGEKVMGIDAEGRIAVGK
ncbi:MAG: hypothetical protein IJH05_08320 [Firmicutes bacterium]|nr:hypothetical protein [Bacillota bacterium]